MDNEQLIAWSTIRIQSHVDFYFPGNPAAFMEFESRDETEPQRIIFRVYSYIGDSRRLLVRTLTHEIEEALDKLNVTPICIIWRAYPQLAEIDLAWEFRMRLAVMDQNLNQLELDIPSVKEGAKAPLLT